MNIGNATSYALEGGLGSTYCRDIHPQNRKNRDMWTAQMHFIHLLRNDSNSLPMIEQQQVPEL